MADLMTEEQRITQRRVHRARSLREETKGAQHGEAEEREAPKYPALGLIAEFTSHPALV